MSQAISGVTRTFEAENAMVNPFRIVKLGTAANQIDLGAVSSDLAVGVTLASASADTDVTVVLTGTAKVYCSAAVTKGANIVCAGSGVGLTGTASTNPVVGIALETTTAAGILEMLLTPGRVQA